MTFRVSFGGESQKGKKANSIYLELVSLRPAFSRGSSEKTVWENFPISTAINVSREEGLKKEIKRGRIERRSLIITSKEAKENDLKGKENRRKTFSAPRPITVSFRGTVLGKAG